MNEKVIKKIIKEAVDNPDGFTLKITNGKHIKHIRFTKDKRYAVSLTNNNTKQKTLEFLRKLPNNFNGYIGGWLDKNTYEYYIDLTIVVSDLTVAKIIGRQFRQKAIWDGLKMNEISLEG